MTGSTECVLYDRPCLECGECDRCDLNPAKRCDDCMKCLGYNKDGNDVRTDYRAVRIDGLLTREDMLDGEDDTAP